MKKREDSYTKPYFQSIKQRYWMSY